MLSKLFKRHKIIPEVLYAIKYKLPDNVEVDIKEDEKGNYFANMKSLPGCATQARNPQELFEMVNDAIFTYFEVPEQYQPYLKVYIPL
jgi:predicted RNase H-like HicB family nuclease